MGKLVFSANDLMLSEKPWDYMIQSGWDSPGYEIPEDELLLLLSLFDEMDDYHLSFALAIAERFAPAQFALAAARLLGSPTMSVRVNAYRVIRTVPAASVSDSLREAVTAALVHCPERSDFADVLQRDDTS